MRKKLSDIVVALTLTAAVLGAMLIVQTPKTALSGPRPQFATIDGSRVYYESHGQGAEALVFVHGWACDLTFWRLQVPDLKKYRALFVDLPGHGKSDKPQIAYTQDLFARSLHEVLRSAGVERAILVGHSLAGLVVREFSRIYPVKTRAVVIVDGTFGPLGSADFLRGLDYLKAASRLIDGLFIPQTPSVLREEIKSKMLRTPQHVMVSAWQESNDAKIWKGDKIEVPVLAIYSTMWSSRAENFIWRIGTSPEYRELAGVGHFLMMEKPKEFNEILMGFLSKHKF